MANDPKLQIQIDAFTEGFKKGLAEAGSSLDSFKNKSEEAGEKSSTSMFKAVLGANLLVEGTKKLLSVGMDMGKSFIQNAVQIEQVKVSFDVLLGSGQKAGQMMKDLANFALATPFELPQLQEGAKKLLAYGISATGILPIMKSLGEVTAAVGTEKLPFLTLALGQVYTAGRLMGTELRQFSENGVPLLGELAKHFNTTTQAVQTMVTNGKIGFKDVAETLFAMTGQGGRFFGLMGKQATTAGGMWSNIKDAIGQTGNALLGLNDKGEILNGGFFSIMRGGLEQVMNLLMNFKMLVSGQIDFSSFLQLAGFSEPVIQAVMAVGNAFQWVWGMIGMLLQNSMVQGLAWGTLIYNVVGSLVIPALAWLWTTFFGTFGMITKAVMFLVTSPFVWIITGVALLFVAWQTNFLGIRDVTQNVLGWIGENFANFGKFILINLDGIVTGIFDGTNWIISAFNLLIDFLVKSFAPMFGDVIGFLGWGLKQLAIITGEVIGTLVGVFGIFLQWIMPAVLPVLKALVTAFGEIFKNIMLIVVGATKFISGIFSGDWRLMAEGLVEMLSGIIGGVASIMDGVITVIRQGIAGVLGMMTQLTENEWVSKGLDILGLGDAKNKINELKADLEKPFTGIQDDVKSLKSMALSAFGVDQKANAANIAENKNLDQGVNDTINGILQGIDKMGVSFAKVDFSEIKKSITSGANVIGTTVDGMAQQAKSMLLELAKNPPEIAKLGEEQKQALKSLIQSIGQGAVDFGNQLKATKVDAIKLPEFKLDIKLSDKAMVDMNAQIKKQQEEFLASIKNTAKTEDGSGSKKSPADKEADAKQKAMSLQKQQIEAEIKQTKDKYDGELNTLEAQKKELENKQKLLQITQEDLKLNTSKSDELEKQLEKLQDNQTLNGKTKESETEILLLKQKIGDVKDQEKADYEKAQALRDKQKKDYELAKFNLETAIDQKKTDEENALKPLQSKKQLLDTQLLNSNVDQFNAGNSAYSIPSFATGVENFSGGLAKVHKGEVLMNLPKGTSVINQDRGQKTGFGGVTQIFNFDGMIIREQADLDYIVNEIGRRFNSATI